jgi:NitT/TauT family transport system substrate-binding protein
MKKTSYLRRTGPRLAIAMVIALVLGAAAACSSSSSNNSAGGKSPDKISIAFGLPLGNSSNPFAWIGDYLGYFKQQNVDPDIISLGGDSARGNAQLASGQLDVGIFGLEAVLDSAAAGHPLKAEAVYNVQSKSQYEGVVNPDSPITALTDLKGKKIGIPQLDGTLETYVNATLASAGLQNAGVKFVAVGIGAPMGQALKNGEVAAAFATRGQLGTLESGGYKLRYLPRPPFAENFITGNVVARTDLSPSKQRALKEYLRAYSEAIVFSEANPTAAMLINWHMYPDAVPKNVPFQQALDTAVTTFKAYLSYITPLNGKWGYMPPDKMQAYNQFLGLTGKVDITKYYTNDLIAYANDFDQQAIINQAKNYKAPNP